jgi:hypothetical protein
METWKFKLVDLYTFELLDTVASITRHDSLTLL